MLSPLFPKPTQGHQPFLNASFNLSYQIRYDVNRKLKRTGFCALTMNTSFLNRREDATAEHFACHESEAEGADEIG